MFCWSFIIFMVITPLASKGLQAQIPTPNHESHPEQVSTSQVVIVRVLRDGTIQVNSRPVVESALADFLARVRLTSKASSVFVKGAPELEFAQVAGIVDVARMAGFTTVGLLPDHKPR